MLAIVVKGVNQFALEQVNKPGIQKATDVVLCVTAAAICTSDVYLIEGFLPANTPFILGHEFIGVVENVGSAVSLFKPGDRVVVPPSPYCGTCIYCRQGLFCQCLTVPDVFGCGGKLPGGFAEYVRVPHADFCLVPIPNHVSDEQAVLIGDMLNTGYFAVDNCKLKPGNTVAVFGAGPVGLCAVLAARLFGPEEIILIDSLNYRLELGRRMGATRTINYQEKNVVAEIRELLGARGVNAAIVAVGGNPAVIESAVRVVSAGGILSIIGLFPKKIEFPIRSLYMKNITTKIGLANFDNIHQIMSFVANGKLDPTPLITHRMPLRDFDKAYTIFRDKREEAIKVILNPTN